MRKLSISVLVVSTLILFPMPAPAAAETPETIVTAYHQAILDGDIEAAKGVLAEDLVLFEDGVAETSLKHYTEGHLKSDIAFSARAERKLESRSSWIEEDTATVGSIYDLKTKYKGKSYHLKSAETMTLKRVEGQWVIVHIHWSNHKLGK